MEQTYRLPKANRIFHLEMRKQFTSPGSPTKDTRSFFFRSRCLIDIYVIQKKKKSTVCRVHSTAYNPQAADRFTPHKSFGLHTYAHVSIILDRPGLTLHFTRIHLYLIFLHFSKIWTFSLLRKVLIDVCSTAASTTIVHTNLST